MNPAAQSLPLLPLNRKLQLTIVMIYSVCEANLVIMKYLHSV